MKNLAPLDWQEVLRHLQNFCTSGSARLLIQDLSPLNSAEQARQNMERVFHAAELLGTGVRPHMESLDLFEAWSLRLKKKATLKTLEIRDVRLFCLETVALTESCTHLSNRWAQELLQRLMDAEKPLSAIDQIMTPSGEIRSDASETLYRLFREKDSLSKQIQTTLDRLVSDHQMSNYLQDKYVTTREGRWVLPVRSGKQHSVSGVIHGSSQTKQTVFMEPEAVVPINNRLRQVEVEIEEEIERLLQQLSEYLQTLSNDFISTREVLLETDALLAQSQFNILIQGRSVTFTDVDLTLVDIKHPLLQLAGKNPVANTVKLTEKLSLLLLSGPNAGGKTVLLKSIGLAAQMARCGLPICSGEGSRLPFFKKILIGIGDSQSVDEELSTFAAHLKVLQQASELRGLDHLILIDEICGSTDPEEGSALARSFIEQFSKNNCFGVITSHLGPLKSGWREQDRVLNGSLEYDSHSGRPTYQFLQGIPGDSLAIQTAKRVGVASPLVERALELLTPETRARLAGLDELEQIKTGLQQLQADLKKDQQSARKEKEKYEALKLQLEKEKADVLLRTKREAERKIEELISQAKVENTFKKHTALQDIKHQLPEIIKSRIGNSGVDLNATNASGSSSAIGSADEFSRRYPPGTKIYVPSLQQDGIVQSLANGKGEVFVLVGSLRMSLSWEELKPPAQAQNPTARLVRRSSGTTIALTNNERVLDLRGQTVEEALSQLESELDLAVAQKEDRIKIIHGHGTDTLKRAVRTYLSRSQYVSKWKAAAAEQGGDGVTWAELS